MKNSLGKLSVGAFVTLGLLGQACGGDDSTTTPSGDGDGDVSTGGTVAGTGATAATGGTATTGGTTGSGGTTATGGTGPVGTGMAVNTPITSGSVVITAGHGADEESGFEGFFWTTTDMGGSTIAPADFSMMSATEETENKVCANGTAAQVVDMMWDTIWGAQVGWNLGQPADVMTEVAVDLSSTTGLSFTIEQATAAPMRFQVSVGTDVYCTNISAGANTVAWTDLTLGCWEAGGAAFDPSANEVTAVAWSVPATDTAATPFDFCIGGLDFTGDGGGAGGAGGSN